MTNLNHKLDTLIDRVISACFVPLLIVGAITFLYFLGYCFSQVN